MTLIKGKLAQNFSGNICMCNYRIMISGRQTYDHEKNCINAIFKDQYGG